MPRLFLLTLFSLCSYSFSAEESSTADRYQQYASSGLLSLSSSIDYFFGGIRVDEESNGTYGRVTFLTRMIEKEKITFKPRIRLRVELPGTKKKLKLVFDDDEGSNASATGSNTQSVTGDDRTTDGLNAALRFIVKQKRDWNVNFDTGLKIRIGKPLDPFMRLRARRSHDFGNWQFRAVQEFYEYLKRSTISRTVVDFDYPMKDGFLFRFGNGAEWTNEDDYFKFSTGFTLFQKLNDKKAMTYNIRASGKNEPKSTFTSYDFFLTYRQLLHKNWFYVNLTPGIQLPKSRDFKDTMFLFIEFQALVGNFK